MVRVRRTGRNGYVEQVWTAKCEEVEEQKDNKMGLSKRNMDGQVGTSIMAALGHRHQMHLRK